MTSIRIPTGMNGPAGSANGGVAAGTIAGLLDGAVSVRLHAPPPLDVDLPVTTDQDGVVTAAGADGAPVLSARAVPRPTIPLPDIDPATVGEGTPLTEHPAATCVVCGPERADGLRLFPAPVPDHPGVLGTWWTPPTWASENGVLRNDLLWGVLDCPGALALMHQTDEPMFAALGSVTGEVLAPVRADERVLVLGFVLGRDGRKQHAGTAVLGREGDLRAHTTQLCIALPPAWAGPQG